MPCTWIKPKLVCEIKFGEWTQENIMRIPVFLGIREDKNARDVKREEPMPLQKTKSKKKAAPAKKAVAKKAKKAVKNAAPKKTAVKNKVPVEPLLNDTDKKQVVAVNNKELLYFKQNN